MNVVGGIELLSLEICSSGNSYSIENSSLGKEKIIILFRFFLDEKLLKKLFKGKIKKKDNFEGIVKK